LGGVFGAGGLFAANIDWETIDVANRKKTPLFIYHDSRDIVIDAEYAWLVLNHHLKRNGIDHLRFKTVAHLMDSLDTGY
jgi:hypothetical protein